MNLFQLLVMLVVFFIGAASGYGLSRMIASVPPSVLGLVSGCLAVVLFSWPIYKSLGWLPPPPKCQRRGCGARDYELASAEQGESRWRCKRCGQTIIMQGYSVVIMGDDGHPIMKLSPRWPGFVGLWKRVRL
jgi:hypothetical protein